MISNNEIESSRLDRINQSLKGILFGVLASLILMKIFVFIIDRWVYPLLIQLFYPNSCGMWRL